MSLDHRLWMGAVLRAVTKIPPGTKLRVGDLGRALGLPQVDVIACLEDLVSEGRLDAATMRPPVASPAMVAVDPGGCAPPVFVAPDPATTAAPGLADVPTGTDLADRLDALIAAQGLARRRVAQHLTGTPNGIDRLRAARVPRRATVAKVEGFIAAGDWAEFKPRENTGRPAGATRAKAVARSTRVHAAGGPMVQSPFAASSDSGSAVLSAARKRGRERAAADLVDAGVTPASQSTTVANEMREVMRRRAELARHADPVEQCKLALRKRGRIVFDASVDGGRKGRFFVSGQVDAFGKRKQLSDGELAALAWAVNPLEMQRLTGRGNP